MSKYRMLSQRLRPWVVWLALCVALGGALAPAVSHAVQWRQDGAPGYGMVCTTVLDGAFTADANGGAPQPNGGPDRPAGAASEGHCSFCLHSCERVAPPTCALGCALVMQSVLHTTADSCAIFYSSARALAPPPRGPPVA